MPLDTNILGLFKKIIKIFIIFLLSSTPSLFLIVEILGHYIIGNEVLRYMCKIIDEVLLLFLLLPIVFVVVVKSSDMSLKINTIIEKYRIYWMSYLLGHVIFWFLLIFIRPGFD